MNHPETQTDHASESKFVRFAPQLRLAAALALSLAAHAAILFPLHWPVAIDPLAGQIHLQVSLQAKAPVRPPATPAGKPGKETKRDKAGAESGSPNKEPTRLTAPGGTPLPAQTAEASSQDAELSVDAMLLDAAMTPVYPEDALRRNQEGCVLAAVLVNEAGEVSAVEIIAADLPGVFDQAVIESQKTARYSPARRNGDTVPSRVLTVAAFVLEAGRRMNCALKYAPRAEQWMAEAAAK